MKSETSRLLCSLKKLFWKFSGNSEKKREKRESAYWKLITKPHMSSVANIKLDFEP